MYDFIAIGDIVTDAFIRIKDAALHCTVDRDRCEICLRFADKVPYEDVFIVPAVGNSANVAVAAARLGLKSALVSNVGDDYFGKECLDVLSEEHVGSEFMKAHIGRKTNYHYVLWYEDDRTILIKHEEYEYAMPEIGNPRWVYLSSLGGHSLSFHKTLEQYFESHPEVKYAFQPGTFQMKFGKEALEKLYRRAELFFCNREEAQRILGIEENDIKKLLTMVRDLGPKITVITDGVKGAYVFDGNEVWFMPPYPDPKPPFERTGAGDAFSATFTTALVLGMNIHDALMWAPINSMSVVQQVGARAGLLTREQLEAYLKAAPQDYQPKKLEM